MFLEFITIFVISLILVGAMKKYGPELGFIDVPNDRSTHREHTPRAAGIGFSLAAASILPFFHFDLLMQYAWVFLSILLVFVVGVLDDHREASPNTKFIVLIISTVLLSFNGFVIDDVGTFFGQTLLLGWLAIPFTIFAVTGFTNALNLIDGLDGLAATISIVILSTFFMVGYQHDDTFMIVLSMSFIASLLAFLVYNWQPASIFMGDSGSLTLGFVISVLAVKSLDYLPTVSILFIAALPIFDTLIIMVRRKIKGRSIFSADRCHMHHIIRHSFMKNTHKTVFFFGILQAVYSITGLQLDKNMDEGYLLILFLLNTVLLYLFIGAMIKRQKRDC
jgi:UDP-GlcNAc:undecaprenyl-phosphate GlcNAc-1-phosphate transferase